MVTRSLFVLFLCSHLDLTAADATSKATKKAVKPQKVAVLGTGLGNMAAVFYMTNYTGWEQDWDIDVYQYGWRLGGKAASGRTMNNGSGNRILEHGLHILMGWYNNAFMWIQDMYRAWEPPADSPIQTWRDAFKASCGGGIFLHRGNMTPKYRPIAAPTSELVHCGPKDFTMLPEFPRPAPTPWALFVGLIGRLSRYFPDGKGAYSASIKAVDAAVQPASSGPPEVGSARSMHLVDVLQALQKQIVDDLAALNEGKLSDSELASKVGQTGFELSRFGQGTSYVPTPGDLALLSSRLAMAVTAMGVGIVKDDVFHKGFNHLNDETFGHYLARHGCSLSLEDDDLLRTLLDFVVGFVGGMHQAPNFAAGTALRGGLYNEGPLHPPSPTPVPGLSMTPLMRFQAGMGEVIMTPAYEVLKKRGVRFNFFHKVTGLHTTDGAVVDEIDIDVQVTVKNGSASYYPLFPVKGLPVWPDLSSPAQCDGCERFFDQIEESEQLKKGNVNLESFYSGWQPAAKKSLKLGKDFDVILNGITMGALPHVSQDLALKNEAWRNWTSTTETVATRALQVWVYNTTHDLGFGPKNVNASDLSQTETTVCGGPEPMDTWADFSHLAKFETDNALVNGDVPRGVHYWMSPMEFDTHLANFSNTSLPGMMWELAFQESKSYLENSVGVVLPKWGEKLYSSMVAPTNVTGSERLRHQYWRSNYEPGELYVMSAAGSMKYRPTPFKYRDGQLQPFSNMAQVGDHVKNGLDDGCAESATTSGVMAAFGLTKGRSPLKFTDWEHDAHDGIDPFQYRLGGAHILSPTWV